MTRFQGSGLPNRWTALEARAERSVKRLEFLATAWSLLLALMVLAGFLVGLFLVIRSLPEVRV